MLIKSRESGGILSLTLDRPEKRNALSSALAADLAAALDDAASDANLRVIVLTGAGGRAFASGGDLKELAALRSLEEATAMSREFRAVLDKIRHFPVPVIAAINGDALGGGAELAMACDIRIAAAHSRIGFLQGKLAISTAWGGGIDLFEAVGVSRATRLLATAEILSARQALDYGLVEAVAGDDDAFNNFVERFVHPLVARPPQVMRAIKALGTAARTGMAHTEKQDLETRHFAATWVHDDHWSAVEASLGRAGRT